MREKRKRMTTLVANGGLAAGEKLNRNRLLMECDLRWNWIGTEAKHVSDITDEHYLRAAGLGLLGGKRPCPNKYLHQSPGHSPNQRIGRNHEDQEDVIVLSDDEEYTQCEKKRCKDNPYCSNYLGQEKWENKEKAEETYIKAQLKDEDPRIHSRGDAPVGLKNLGATCYANAFLQVWFQELAFRSGVYRCQLSPDNKAKLKDSPIFQLQVTFTALQEGRLSVFNPIKLVESLRLRTSEQQDAQEFSKLFMSHLDDEFKKQSNPELQSLLSNQFEGKMVNATVCDKCKTRSERDTTFLELEVNLDKNGTLEDRIASILEPERLDENNKYFCSVCESLQDATRYTEIRTLPPVLHISLLRFVYDLTTYERRKSKLPLRFPPYLNMKPFLQSADPDQMICDDGRDAEIYELRGVLLHKGPSAYHGHYEAQVYNQQTKKWYQFNDEIVTPLSSFYSAKPSSSATKEAIVVDEDITNDRPIKRQKRPTNNRRIEDSDQDEILPETSTNGSAGVKLLSSKDAYMLIYARRDDAKLANMWQLDPPPDALEIIKRSNEAHEKTCAEYDAKKEEKKAEFTKIRDNVRDVYLSWHVSSASDPSIVVSKAALEKWLLSPLTPTDPKEVQGKTSDTNEENPIGKESRSASDVEMTCPEVGTTVNGSPSSRDAFFDNTILLCPYGHDEHEQRLSPLSDKTMKVISRVARDKLVNSGFTFKPELTVDSVCRRCVENEFLEKLYQMEHPRLVTEFNEICSTATENQGFWISKVWLKDWQLNKPKMHVPSQPDPSPESSSDDPASDFRSHIYCEHGSLSLSVAARRRISAEAVQLLKRLFEDWNPPSWNTETCAVCDVEVHKSKESKLEQRRMAENEKAQFQRLNSCDIFGPQACQFNKTYAVVPAEFIHSWRKWLLKPGDSPRPTDLGTQTMVCNHGNPSRLKLVYDLEESDFDNDFAVLTIAEWKQLQTIYGEGTMVKIDCMVDGHGQKHITHDIPCCPECRLERKLNFDLATITVAFIDKDTILELERDFKSFEEQYKERLGPASRSYYVSEKTNALRQSRRLQSKSSKYQRIRVRKTSTIKDIKVTLYNAYKIPTISQRLYYQGKELDDNSKTVADLQILNKDMLFVGADDEDAIVLDSDMEDEGMKGMKKRAEGDAFKGTLLSGGMSSSLPNEPVDVSMDPTPSSPAQKACPACTLLNAHDAVACEACDTHL